MSLKVQKVKLLFWIAIIALPIDQLTKYLAREYLSTIYEYYWGPLWIRFELAENSGAFLGFGANWDETIRFWILTVVVFFVLIWALWSLLKSNVVIWYEVWGFLFLLVGGTGNLIDRIHKGTVTDYVQIGIGSLATGIFNFVDMMILTALFLMLLGPLFHRRQQEARP